MHCALNDMTCWHGASKQNKNFDYVCAQPFIVGVVERNGLVAIYFSASRTMLVARSNSFGNHVM